MLFIHLGAFVIDASYYPFIIFILIQINFQIYLKFLP